jgi:hypothetical protein
MKNIIAATLVTASLVLSCQSVLARNPAKDILSTPNAHHGTTNAITIGGYLAGCESLNGGIAQAGPRTINVNGHNQGTAHLEAQGDTFAEAFVQIPVSTPLVINGPISFTIAKGNGNRLVVIVAWTTPGSTTPVSAGFVTPDSKIADSTTTFLTSNGHGNYSIPVGDHGIPFGSIIVDFIFNQDGNAKNCVKHSSDINELSINRTFIGIEQSGAEVCGTSCSGQQREIRPTS